MAFNQGDLDVLFQGLWDGVDLNGTAGALTVFGPRAFPILVGNLGSDGMRHAIAAAARLGEGKIVGFSHDCYTHPQTDIQRQLLKNCVTWTLTSKKEPAETKVGILGFNQPLKTWRDSAAFKVTEITLASSKDATTLVGFDAIIIGDINLVTDQTQVDALKFYVKRGGGLVIAATAWAYDKDVLNISSNLICHEAGFGWTKEYAVTPISSEKFKPLAAHLENVHAGDAWHFLTAKGGQVDNPNLANQLKSVKSLAEKNLPQSHPLVQAITANRSVRYHDEDLKALLEGLENGVEKSGTVGLITVFGPDAFTILPGKYSKDDSIQAVGGGARYGNGRVAAFAHTCFTNPSNPSLYKCLTNCVNWAARKVEGQKIRVGVLYKYYLTDWLALNEDKFTFQYFSDSGALTEELGVIDVLIVTDVHRLANVTHARLVKEYIINGGGMVISATGWAQTVDIKTEFSANLLLRHTGIAWSGYSSTSATEEGRKGFTAPFHHLEDTHAHDAWKLLLWHIANKISLPSSRLSQLSSIVSIAADSLSNTGPSSFPAKIKFEMEELGIEAKVPSESSAISDPIEKFKLKMLVNYVYNAEAGPGVSEECQCHPATRYFPGLPAPGATRTTNHPISVELSYEAWYSTGLYAGPGEEIVLKFPKSPLRKISVQIGSHSDDISAVQAWKRCPVLRVTKPLVAGATELRIRNAFGGLIYIRQNGSESTLEKLEVNVSGAILAPHFVLGKTTLEQWREIRNRGAPWGELETKKVILTLPGPKLATLENPIELMEFWNKVLDAQAELGGISLDRKYPERIVADVQISAGYMHSGYPIMMLTDEAVDTALSVKLLKSRKAWGHYHELGHNHQVGAWNFSLVGETTNNMFALYVFEKVCGLTPAEARPDKFEPAALKAAIEANAKKGPNYDDWGDDPFLALLFYYQLKAKYGWAAYMKVFKAYQTQKIEPSTEQDKVDTWLVQFSMAVGESLTSLFKAWGVRVSDSAVVKIAHLPQSDQTIFSLIK